MNNDLLIFFSAEPMVQTYYYWSLFPAQEQWFKNVFPQIFFFTFLQCLETGFLCVSLAVPELSVEEADFELRGPHTWIKGMLGYPLFSKKAQNSNNISYPTPFPTV